MRNSVLKAAVDDKRLFLCFLIFFNRKAEGRDPSVLWTSLWFIGLGMLETMGKIYKLDIRFWFGRRNLH